MRQNIKYKCLYGDYLIIYRIGYIIDLNTDLFKLLFPLYLLLFFYSF